MVAEGLAPPAGDTKDRLLRAGERLFARDGIHRVRLREINELAGQRNPSALHYHFGSREGLVQAILVRHQGGMDADLAPALDALEARPTIPPTREVVEAVVRPLAQKLTTPSGRDFLRILPQVIDTLSAGLRQDEGVPAGRSPRRVLVLLGGCMGELPEVVRRERLVTYNLLLTSLMAERALQIESGALVSLDHEQFVTHVLDAVEGLIDAPSNVRMPEATAAT
jgi:AcrR family transcriptional regulator